MTGVQSGPDTGVIGYVHGRAVSRSRLDERVSRLRTGARAALLPVPGSAEDRQLARWITQVILVEELCTVEAARLGAMDAGAAGRIDELAAVELGSIIAAAWANCAAVRALFALLTAPVEVTEEEVHAYWRATARGEPARWLLRHRLGDGPTHALGPVGGPELPTAIATAIAEAPVGSKHEVTDALGHHTVVVEARWPANEPDYRQDAAGIRDQLVAAAKRAAFVRWLDAARATHVVNVAGLEHPGDPDQPDNHHKH